MSKVSFVIEARPTIERARKPKNKWDIYLFLNESPEPILIETNVRTKVAELAVSRWDHRKHESALVHWPSNVPVPKCWGNVKPSLLAGKDA
jgi:hypothetical protein